MPRLPLPFLATIALLVSSLDAASADLISNSSFEVPAVPAGGFLTYATSFTGWTVVGSSGGVSIVSGSYGYNGFSFPADAGGQWLDLTGNGSNSGTGVEQTVPTTPCMTYALSFAVGNVVDALGGLGSASTVEVWIDGSLAMSATNSQGAGTQVQSWKSFSTSFTASSSATQIRFINGDPVNDNYNGLDSISLIATASGTAWSASGAGLAGVTGEPALTGMGALVAGCGNSVALSNAAPFATSGLFAGFSSTPIPFKGGTLWVFPFIGPVMLSTSASGTKNVPFFTPAGLPPGTEIWAQWAVLDTAAVRGVALSNAVVGIAP